MTCSHDDIQAGCPGDADEGGGITGEVDVGGVDKRAAAERGEACGFANGDGFVGEIGFIDVFAVAPDPGGGLETNRCPAARVVADGREWEAGFAAPAVAGEQQMFVGEGDAELPGRDVSEDRTDHAGGNVEVGTHEPILETCRRMLPGRMD